MSPLLAGLWVLLAAGPPHAAPVPLAGTWQQRQTAFVARREISHALQEQLNDSATAALNARLRRGQATIRLTLNPNGSYQRTQAGKGQEVPTTEAGTYRLGRDTLYLRAASPGPVLPSALRVVRLTRRVLVLEFLLWEPADAVFEQLEFRRH
ncbi:hypothetical protein ACVWYF_002958 [Hymenobacter sp. UYAg731]